MNTITIVIKVLLTINIALASSEPPTARSTNAFAEFVGEYQVTHSECKDGNRSPLFRGTIEMIPMDPEDCADKVIIFWRDQTLFLDEVNSKGESISTPDLEVIPTKIRSIARGYWLTYSKHLASPSSAVQIYHVEFTEYRRRERDFLNWKTETRIHFHQKGTVFYYENVNNYVKWKSPAYQAKTSKKYTLKKITP